MDCGNIVKFKNCQIMRDHKIYKEDLWVREGKIIDPEKVFFDEKKSAGQVIDIGGNLIAPGFIDTQINGGFGYDFSYDIDRIDKGLGVVSKGILAHGVTAFCPTLVTSKPETYHKILPRLKKRAGGEHGAEVLGAHIEGPFISKEKKGAHSIDDIQDITNGIDSLIEVYGSLENIRIITLAPEKTHNSDVISKLVENEITVSLGHSIADIKTGELAVQQGASLITHLFNAMLPFHHRDPGLVGLLASTHIPSIHYGIIADGVHTHPTTLRIAHRANPEGLVLVTDAISAMGLAEGIHHLGEKQIDVRGDHAYVANTTTLCGSVATMAKCVKYFKAAASCSLVEALEAASLHPAKALNIHHKKGTLNYNSDADFVVLNDNLDVVSTWIAGKKVYFAH